MSLKGKAYIAGAFEQVDVLVGDGTFLRGEDGGSQ